MTRQYRVGVIGHTGRGDYGHGLDSVWCALPDCELVGVADADPAGLAKAVANLKAPQGYDDYRKLLDEAKPAIVSIGMRWIDQHHDIVMATAERGIHIYMEKPFCRTLAEADAMVSVCEKHGVKLAIACQTRYSPKLKILRSMIEGGKIGEVVELRGRGKEDGRGGGEDLWVLGTHVMNLIHYFAGEPQWCCATVLNAGRPIRKEDVQQGNEGIGPLAGDNLSAMFGLDRGATAYFGSRRGGAPGGKGRFGLRIFGTAGVIELTTGYLPEVKYLPESRWSTSGTDVEWIPVSSAGPGEAEPLADGSAHAGNVAACLDLIASIEEDRQPMASMYEARTTVEMIAAVFESHRLGGRVAIPLESRQNPLTLLGSAV